MAVLDNGEVSGWHYATRRPVCVAWKDRRIVRVLEPANDPPKGAWIAPSLFDLQVNGYAGVDFQSDTCSEEDLLQAARGLRADGCGKFLLTLITDDWPKLTARFRRLRALRLRNPELRSSIVGWHIEGPFLSSAAGFCGTHDAERMLDPTPKHILELAGIAEGDPLLLTLAPERDGAMECIRLAASRGVRVSLGHTNASAEVLRAAIDAGAVAFTHLGNGCGAELNRHDNILWRVLDQEGLFATLIPDGIHVSAPLFRLFHRSLPRNRICYITDAMSAAGAAPGLYTLGRLKLQVGPDEVVRQPGTTYLSGSALRPIQGVLRAARMLGCNWKEAWQRFSTRPAELMGLPQRDLAEGEPADFCVLQEAIAGDLRLIG